MDARSRSPAAPCRCCTSTTSQRARTWRWRLQADGLAECSAFLEAYLETVEPSLLPAGRPATEKLLAIFELEKAVYELRYELNNRPDWVPIPVAGIVRLLDSE